MPCCVSRPAEDAVELSCAYLKKRGLIQWTECLNSSVVAEEEDGTSQQLLQLDYGLMNLDLPVTENSAAS